MSPGSIGPVFTCACGDLTTELRCPACGRATTLAGVTRLKRRRPRAFYDDKREGKRAERNPLWRAS